MSKIPLPAIKKIILQTVQETGGGPSGVMYSALVGVIDINEYESIIQSLIQEKKITRTNHWLAPV